MVLNCGFKEKMISNDVILRERQVFKGLELRKITVFKDKFEKSKNF